LHPRQKLELIGNILHRSGTRIVQVNLPGGMKNWRFSTNRSLYCENVKDTATVTMEDQHELVSNGAISNDLG